MLLRANSGSVSTEAILRARTLGDQLSEFVAVCANPKVSREVPLILSIVRPDSVSGIETMDALHGLYSGGTRQYTEVAASNRPSYIHWAGRIAGSTFYVAERYIDNNPLDRTSYSELEAAYAMAVPPKLLPDLEPMPQMSLDRDALSNLGSRVIGWVLDHPVYT